MEWIVPITVAVVIVLSMAALAIYTKRRHWNVDHEDDERRNP